MTTVVFTHAVGNMNTWLSGRSMPPTRNNRIKEADFLNRSCAFDAGFESMLLGDLSFPKMSSGVDSLREAESSHH
jgi:hypothetical protein